MAKHRKHGRPRGAPPGALNRPRPLLSIAIPAYRAGMLERCLRNLASVTVDCEIVVVDDASPDDLRQVVNAAGDARIRFFRNPKNLGIPGNFNRALAEARGTYVCMLGDDDQFLPGNFEKKLAVLEANPHVGFVYSPWNAVTPEGRVVYSRLAAHPQQSYIGGRREFMDLFTGNYINLAAIVFRRSLLEKHGAFDERLTTLCDWDMFLRWSRQTETAYLAEALATVLVHDDSDTARRGLQEQRFAKEKLAVWRKWLIEQQPSLVIDDETWLRMAQFFSADLSHWFGSDTATIQQYSAEFEQLQRDYQARTTTFPVPRPKRERGRPKLSIVVPAYDRPDMLGECLASLASVTSDCEIVVVDDRSPTDLGPVVEQHAERDPRIRFVRNETNLGPTPNFNKAISLARGEYFCLLGDDETVLPGNFEKKLAVLDSHTDIGFVYSRHYYTDGANNNIGLALWPGMLNYSYVGGRDEFNDLLPWNYISLHSVVYRKQLFDRLGGFDEHLTECGNDWELNLRYAFHSSTAYIDEPLLNVRVHDDANTRKLGLLQSKLAEGRISVWRKWLVQKDQPVVLDERSWARMQALYERDVRHWFAAQPALIDEWLPRFAELRRQAEAAVSRHFFASVPGLEPAAADPLPSPLPEGEGVPVVWEGGFFETHSLALVNRELALAMAATGQVELSLRVRQLEGLTFDPRADMRLAPLLASVDRPLAAPSVHIRHAWPPVFDRPAQGKWVMIQPWEYGRLPVEWVGPMRDQVDEIWAYTNAVRQFYIDSGVPGEKVFVVPMGINPDLFRPEAAPLELPTQKRVRFLFVGGTIWRKGIDLLLEAYRRTFTREDSVSLVIKDMGQDSFYKGQGAAEAIAKLQADPQAPEILYVTGALSDRDMPSLYTACTCLVHPYRGEGFGLPVAEAMACGLPPILTRGGACDDFCIDDAVYWVPSTRVGINLETPTAGQAWVLQADVNALAAQMLAVYHNPEEARARGRRASDHVRRHFTWTAAAEQALGRIQALATGKSRPRTALEYFEEGRAAVQRDDFEGGERLLQRAVQENPDLAGAWYLLGAARTQLGNHREALAAYERAVSLRPDVSDFHNGLGTALCFLMDEASLVRAFSCFQRATQLDPANARAWVNVIELALRVAQLDVAEQALGRARELLPDDEQLAWLAFDIANARAIEHAPVPYRPAPPELDSLRRRPRISVLVPIHNVPLQYFQELLVCLEQQRYPEWELCAIDDASTDEQLRNALSDAAGRDPRIRIEFLPESLNISGATNVALEMASGEYVAFLDHDDLLDPDALLYVAGALDEDPQPDVIYSDEDKLTLDGRYAEPYTKADWSPELLLSNMYMAHLLVMRKALVEEVGGLRSAFNGAQDFDLALRVTERANRIRHLPVMLYHWRKIPGSTADDISSKPYAADAGARAVAEAMSRRGLSGSLEHGYQPCTYRPRINIPACRVSAIILSPGRPEALQRCISSLHASAGGRDLEIVLASQDGEPFNYSRWNNLAVQKATGDVLLFLNDDIEAADAGWLDALLEFAFFPGVGAVGSRLLYPGAERRVEHAGIGLGLGGVAGKLHRGLPENWLTVLGPMRIANYSAVSGACMMLRREAFERVGGFDEAFANHFGDVDLCLRLWQAGLRVVYTPFAALLHHATLPWEEETSEDSPEAALMVERWATWLANDPFLNPAIPRVCEEFSRWQAMYWPGTALRMLETRRQVAHAV